MSRVKPVLKEGVEFRTPDNDKSHKWLVVDPCLGGTAETCLDVAQDAVQCFGGGAPLWQAVLEGAGSNTGQHGIQVFGWI